MFVVGTQNLVPRGLNHVACSVRALCQSLVLFYKDDYWYYNYLTLVRASWTKMQDAGIKNMGRGLPVKYSCAHTFTCRTGM